MWTLTFPGYAVHHWLLYYVFYYLKNRIYVFNKIKLTVQCHIRILYLGPFNCDEKDAFDVGICRILTYMSLDEIKRLGTLLYIKEWGKYGVSKEAAANRILEWAKEWKEELHQHYRKHEPTNDIPCKHRELNNDLVDNGFFDFAYHLMVYEKPLYIV